MIDINHLLQVADTYALANGIEEKTVSNRVFQDGKKLAAVRSGKEITVGRFNAALEWFDANWPPGVQWPERVARPSLDFDGNALSGNQSVVVPENSDHHVPAVLDKIARQMADEFGFKPSRLQVIQFMARKTGYSVS